MQDHFNIIIPSRLSPTSRLFPSDSPTTGAYILPFHLCVTDRLLLLTHTRNTLMCRETDMKSSALLIVNDSYQ